MNPCGKFTFLSAICAILSIPQNAFAFEYKWLEARHFCEVMSTSVVRAYDGKQFRASDLSHTIYVTSEKCEEPTFLNQEFSDPSDSMAQIATELACMNRPENHYAIIRIGNDTYFLSDIYEMADNVRIEGDYNLVVSFHSSGALDLSTYMSLDGKETDTDFYWITYRAECRRIVP